MQASQSTLPSLAVSRYDPSTFWRILNVPHLGAPQHTAPRPRYPASLRGPPFQSTPASNHPTAPSQHIPALSHLRAPFQYTVAGVRCLHTLSLSPQASTTTPLALRPEPMRRRRLLQFQQRYILPHHHQSTRRRHQQLSRLLRLRLAPFQQPAVLMPSRSAVLARLLLRSPRLCPKKRARLLDRLLLTTLAGWLTSC